MNIVEPIFWQCRSKPAEIAIAAPGTDLNIVSYARLEYMIDNLCHRIISSGLVAGDRVAVYIVDQLLHSFVLIALTRLGIVTSSGHDKGFKWPFSLTAVISDTPFQSFSGRLILIDFGWISGIDAKLDQKHIHFAAPDDLCCIFLTSVPMGAENAVAITNQIMIERLTRQYLFLGSLVSGSSRIFTDLSMTTSLGFHLLFATLWRGGAFFLKGAPQMTFNALPIYRVQSAVMTPVGISELLEFANKRASYECRFETIFSTGGSVSQDLINQARMRLSPNISVGYYLTESGMVSSMPVQFGSGIIGASGFILPDVLVQIVDDKGTALPPNRVGTVRIKSWLGVTEYLEDPTASSIMFRDDWFYPGDSGYLTNDNMLVIAA